MTMQSPSQPLLPSPLMLIIPGHGMLRMSLLDEHIIVGSQQTGLGKFLVVRLTLFLPSTYMPVFGKTLQLPCSERCLSDARRLTSSFYATYEDTLMTSHDITITMASEVRKEASLDSCALILRNDIGRTDEVPMCFGRARRRRRTSVRHKVSKPPKNITATCPLHGSSWTWLIAILLLGAYQCKAFMVRHDTRRMQFRDCKESVTSTPLVCAPKMSVGATFGYDKRLE